MLYGQLGYMAAQLHVVIQFKTKFKTKPATTLKLFTVASSAVGSPTPVLWHIPVSEQ